MHRARVVPGWQYYRSGRYRSFQFLGFQSMVSSPGKQAVTCGAPLIISVTIILVRVGDMKWSRRDHQETGPNLQPYKVRSSCGAPSEQFVVHLNKNCEL